MLHLKGGGSHTWQAGAPPPGVSPPGLFATTHCWAALADIPPVVHPHGRGFGDDFCTSADSHR